MKIIGIICEYNPFHMGHRKQLDRIRAQNGADCGIVCLMSGNFVQRGAPAIFPRAVRAQAAVLCGADLVLELPVTCALSSAEGFAAGGVQLLSSFCDGLSFGMETDDRAALMKTAEALLSPAFSEALRKQLDKGLSFPAARQAALGTDGRLLSSPNNILAVEYCKAILSQNSKMEPLPLQRQGNYHESTPDPKNPSATSVRRLLLDGQDWQPYVPDSVRSLFETAVPHCLSAGERAILARLRTMSDGEFEVLPYGSEGLWRKFMGASRSCDTLEAIISATKSKRYTRSRIDRMVMCAFLGLTAEDLAAPVPYAKVLAFNEKGRGILKAARNTGLFPNCGEKNDHPFQMIEQRTDDLYGLFSAGTPDSPGSTFRERVFFLR